MRLFLSLSLACVQGGSEFATDLTRAMRKRHTYSGTGVHVPFTVDFVRVKSYEGTESSGKGAWAPAGGSGGDDQPPPPPRLQ
jgi:hypoxanthine-guanine phosphoribosyltransferase